MKRWVDTNKLDRIIWRSHELNNRMRNGTSDDDGTPVTIRGEVYDQRALNLVENMKYACFEYLVEGERTPEGFVPLYTVAGMSREEFCEMLPHASIDDYISTSLWFAIRYAADYDRSVRDLDEVELDSESLESLDRPLRYVSLTRLKQLVEDADALADNDKMRMIFTHAAPDYSEFDQKENIYLCNETGDMIELLKLTFMSPLGFSNLMDGKCGSTTSSMVRYVLQGVDPEGYYTALAKAGNELELRIQREFLDFQGGWFGVLYDRCQRNQRYIDFDDPDDTELFAFAIEDVTRRIEQIDSVLQDDSGFNRISEE